MTSFVRSLRLLIKNQTKPNQKGNTEDHDQNSETGNVKISVHEH